MDAFEALYSIKTPGEIIDLPYKWKKKKSDAKPQLLTIEKIG